jgi:hypothetical protein
LLGLNNGPEYTEYSDERGRRGEVRVIAPGDSESRVLPSEERSDSECGTWINVLPKTGLYRLLVRWPSNKPYVLRITLMDSRDPRLDAGITADRISIDWSTLGAPVALTLQPFEPVVFGFVDDFRPAHLAATTSSFEFRIMALDGIKKMQSDATLWSQGITRLESALRANSGPVPPDLLPLSGYQDAGIAFWGRQERLEGRTWVGMRWLGWYTQGGVGDAADPIPLNYVFEAISRDGRYFIMMFADILFSNPPAELLRTVKVLNDPGPSAEAWEARMRALQPQVGRYLDEAGPDSFTPSIRQFDALARSIELK